MKVLGTKLCIKCDEAIARLQELGIEYEYVDFTESIMLLKDFMKFRDIHKEFDWTRGTGTIGIPCFVFENGEITFDLEEAIKKTPTK
ncbi:glutaredoxin [Dorea longicatena]|uniref:glutaredoxin n=1 Tax=Dorea longicatena TaxID=88431 RepID=UPI003F8BCAF4